MRSVTECPFCCSVERTPVVDYNSLILLEKMRESPLAHYAYALCHGCGVLYAVRRPEGDEYEFIYDNFNEFLGRAEIVDPLSYPGPLSSEVIAEIDRLAVPWWLLQEKYSKQDPYYLRSMKSAVTMEEAQIAHIVSAIDVTGFRVLEIRAKTGYSLDVLKRKYGASELCATVLFPVIEYTLEKLYPIDAKVGINFETLDIPFDPPFDLIIATHLLMHALEPAQLLQHVRSYLTPGGYVLFGHENDDETLCAKGKNLISELRCFHFQQFDRKSFRRIIAGNGFEPLFVKSNREGGKDVTMVCLAKRSDEEALATRMESAELAQRLTFYRKWFDESVLALSSDAKATFSDQIEAIEARALAGGYAKRDEGRITPIRRIKTYNEEGYARLNQGSDKHLGPRAATQ